jgi:copper homeostasis protein
MARILEACIEDFDTALSASKLGAHQVEVCADLAQDGLTPEVKLVVRLVSETNLGLKIMIRNRAGNFQYSSADIETMIQQINDFKSLKIDGFVLGATKTTGDIVTLDMSCIIQLCKACQPYPVTIHKAIDTCTDIIDECRKLLSISNIKYVLTSGGESTAWDGRDKLVEMNKVLLPNIEIIAAGKVTKDNVDELANYTGLSHFHGKKIV